MQKILMLGWEFPPLVSGGLATATEGLVSGLLKLGFDVSLVLPYYPFRIPTESNLTIISPEQEILVRSSSSVQEQFTENLQPPDQPSGLRPSVGTTLPRPSHYQHQGSLRLPDCRQLRPDHPLVQSLHHRLYERLFELRSRLGLPPSPLVDDLGDQTVLLGVLAREVVAKMGPFEVIHAHDWMSVNALVLLRSFCDLPIVFHVHSTEVDRGGPFANPRILELESMGMHLADAVITVSDFTKQILINSYGIPAEKIHVVYNAANVQHHELPETTKQKQFPAVPVSLSQEAQDEARKNLSPRVTFVGRLTFQKGPSYFVQAAQQVIAAYPNARFDVVGTGDLWDSMRQYVWELGLNSQFHFHGFLAAPSVEAILEQTDVFVMPSVSEPFGIVALEAIQRGVPVVLSKQSGVAEVVQHALKVDHWDVDLMADRILSLLRYPALRSTVIEHAFVDLRSRSWLRSAQACAHIYQSVKRFVPRSVSHGRTVSLF